MGSTEWCCHGHSVVQDCMTTCLCHTSIILKVESWATWGTVSFPEQIGPQMCCAQFTTGQWTTSLASLAIMTHVRDAHTSCLSCTQGPAIFVVVLSLLVSCRPRSRQDDQKVSASNGTAIIIAKHKYLSMAHAAQSCCISSVTTSRPRSADR